MLPNSLVKENKLKKIRKTLQKQINPIGRLPLPEATRIIETEGVKDTPNVLKALGYKIVWRGISPETAEVIEAEKQTDEKKPLVSE